MTDRFRPCAIIPTYDNPFTVGSVVEGVRRWIPDVIVVDDGSGPAGRQAVEALDGTVGVRTHRRARNGGKGAAVKDGFRIASDLGFTHALQIDADGQHETADVPRFLAAARANPRALVLGEPLFDASAPRARMIGRRITRFWATIETYGRRIIHDPLCGFRVYPLDAASRAGAKGDAMDFDPEIAVRLVWEDVPVVNLPTRVCYLPREAGGVSHFRIVRDDALISWMHTRLVFGAVLRRIFPA
jgi:glycosyltransferase involved in cell wall biosynthesis